MWEEMQVHIHTSLAGSIQLSHKGRIDTACLVLYLKNSASSTTSSLLLNLQERGPYASQLSIETADLNQIILAANLPLRFGRLSSQ